MASSNSENNIKWVSDTSHPQHPLKQLYKNTSFRCDLCRIHSRGLRLRCDTCKFTLHEGCAALPTTLSGDFFLHRLHPLHLETTKPSLLSFQDCLLCGHSIRGASFKCKTCDDVVFHPLCTRLPEDVAGHALHPLHPLRLEERRVSTGDCDACGEHCKKWRYYCGVCDVHIHIECLAKGVDVLKDKEKADEESLGNIVSFLGNVIQANLN